MCDNEVANEATKEDVCCNEIVNKINKQNVYHNEIGNHVSRISWVPHQPNSLRKIVFGTFNEDHYETLVSEYEALIMTGQQKKQN